MCYRFRIISEIRSNNEFSSRETKTPAIRINTKMLNAFLLFSRKRNNEMSWNFHRLVILHISWFLYGSIYRHFTNMCVMALSVHVLRTKLFKQFDRMIRTVLFICVHVHVCNTNYKNVFIRGKKSPVSGPRSASKLVWWHVFILILFWLLEPD